MSVPPYQSSISEREIETPLGRNTASASVCTRSSSRVNHWASSISEPSTSIAVEVARAREETARKLKGEDRLDIRLAEVVSDSSHAMDFDAGLVKEQVGKINVTEFQTYVAIDRRVAYDAFARLNGASKLGGDFGSFKGRNFKMRFIEV